MTSKIYLSLYQISPFDMIIKGIELEENLVLNIQYSTELFKRETIEEFGQHFINILKQITIDPRQKIDEINFLTDEEENILIHQYNNTSGDFPKDKTIHQLFEEQVERSPENIAITYKNNQITYQELNRRSNQLARILRDKGVHNDTVVALMFEKSERMMIAVMAILKAGGGYLPIDPRLPDGRINHILQDSNSKILLTEGELREGIFFDGEVMILENQEIETKETTNLISISTPESLAYIIYTSGSTGNPKGVMIPNRALNNFLWGMIKKYNGKFNEKDNCLSLTNIMFDVSVCELFLPLVCGAKLVINDDRDDIYDVAKLANTIIHKEITFAYIPPLLLKDVYERLKDLNKDLRLNKLLVGVEAIKNSTLNLFLDLKKDMQIINAYGPTETTICSTMYPFKYSQYLNQNVTIGKPIQNTKIYILNTAMKLQPIGAYGEVYIAGAGLAKGYLNQPQMTSEKFVANPFLEGEKMYKTGDLARWRADGNIEFLRRLDHQVKIRGYRIELGEIQNQILSYPSIKEALVLDQKEEGDSPYLVAYLVSNKNVKIKDLRRHLAKTLPEYMIPSYFMEIDRIPLTSNGKIDRRALPKPDGELSIESKIEKPRNPIEEKLVEIWKQVLGLNDLGIEDNFFDLGGHSLKATLLAVKIHKEMSIEIPIREIFEHPTIKGISQYIEEAHQNKFIAITPVEKKEYYGTSSAQKRIYMLQQFDLNNTVYNMPSIKRVEGELEVSKLERAFKELLRRHETLRTSFETIEGEVVQRVEEEVNFQIQLFSNQNVGEAIGGFIRPFDLAKAPLLRVGLLKQTENDHILMFDMHHIISDGISMGILVKEFAEIYGGNQLKPLTIQYKDYCHWQKEQIISGKIEKQKEYWLRQFEGEIPVLNLMGDFPRPAIQSFEGDFLNYKLDFNLTSQLRSICKKTGSTMYMVLLSALNILMSKYTGQEDIIIGSPIGGRSHADLENMIGMFVNTLVMRNYPDGGKNFKEFLGEVRKNTLGAFENQDYQFEELVENLNLKRDIRRNPLFDVMFSMQKVETPNFEVEGLLFKDYSFDNTISKFDFTLLAHENEDDDIYISIEYSTSIFKKETMERLYNHFENILQQITENLEIKLSDIEIITEIEKQQILKGFNATSIDYSRDKTLHQLFQEQVEKSYHSIAVVSGDHKLTYGQLNEKSNQLARVLVNRGVKPETIVGIMLERSLDMIVGIMAILKAGGAFLPIELEYPQDRRRFMLEDSGAKILLTHTGLMEEIVFDGETLLLDKVELEGESKENLKIACSSSELSYIIYTSGSTGRPKGVAVTHRSLNNFVNTFFHKLNKNVGRKDRCLSLTSIAFDVSVAEVFLPITYGATLVLLETNGIYDLDHLVEVIKKEMITFTYLPPTLLQEVGELLLQDKDEIKLDKLLVGVEPIKDETLEIYLKLNPNMRIINGYGPTEATICSTMYEYGADEVRGKNVPIGKPIFNTHIYIVDGNSMLMPIGVPGEICIAGEGLAKEYINRPELTAEKFVDNPFGYDGRMYPTGDLARWLSDGNLEFLGRIDRQVKIRGHRIELGEIESHLLKYEGINEALVVEGKEEGGNNYLCGYIVAKQTITLDEIRRHLAKTLPEYMIPTYIVELDPMPITSSGKINYNQLPKPVNNFKSNTIPPQNHLQREMINIWREILGVENIGIRHNFFDMGGNSFKALRIVSKLKGRANMIDLFRYPTVEDLCELILKGAGEDQLLRRLTSGEVEDNDETPAIVCVPFAGGSAVIYKSLADSLALKSRKPILYGLTLPGHELGDKRELETIPKVASLCVEEIKRTIKKPVILYGHSAGGVLVLEIARRLMEEGYPLKSICIGASMPPKEDFIEKFNFDLDHNQSDEELYQNLRSIDGFEEIVNQEEMDIVIKSFKHDASEVKDYFYNYYLEKKEKKKLTIPIYHIMGTNDPLNKIAKENFKNWQQFGEEVHYIQLENAGHYFLKTHSEELSQIIEEILETLEKTKRIYRKINQSKD